MADKISTTDIDDDRRLLEQAAVAAEEQVSDRLDESGIQADAALAQRCLAGEVDAWEAFYAQCHGALLASIRAMLGVRGADRSLIDEIAARVWYALVADDGELLTRYNPKKGTRLLTFMRLIAKDEIVRHTRAEMRRRKRESKALRTKQVAHPPTTEEAESAVSEFLLTLTPGEQSFAHSYLLAQSPPAEDSEVSAFSISKIWQLTSRIRKKLLSFLER